ncbi:GIY-YIG nuclease family protein [Christiangramia echinicola]|uniref:GIY-YIG nuclease family protein n=1 Tax=Christiangramia echinicola TaxID=279359 RepID=UPI00041E9B37|nr:GIY-YIG nuclease family protein [Christiangramia echinicola]
MLSNDSQSYFTYILTNRNKTVLYIGVTNNLQRRLIEHHQGARLRAKTFTAKYHCIFLIHYEKFSWVQDAIAREKQLKGWLRSKKVGLINENNPEWKFLNDEFSL